MADNPHAHHRQRLREQFVRNGLSSFTHHQMLELLLFYAIPQKDTNPLAHRLLNTFGSIDAVFNASYEQLCAVPGVSHNTAVFLMLQRQMFQQYFRAAFAERKQICSTQQAAELIVPRFMMMQHENVFLVCLDGQCRVLYEGFLSEGSPLSVGLSVRDIFSKALTHHAAAVILAHNHPNSFALPSADDIATTEKLVELLNSAEIALVDHIIVPGIATDTRQLDLNHPQLEYMSMRESIKFQYLFDRNPKG